MKIRYDGPRQSIEVAPFGAHTMGETKEYPDPFGDELLRTSKRQKFKAVAPPAKAKQRSSAKKQRGKTNEKENT